MSKTKLIITLVLLFVGTNVFAEVQRGISGRSQGDVIAIQRDEDIMVYCDFSKQIVLTATNVLCVYNGKTRR